MSLISSKAMLAHVSISQWSARKLDRKVTTEVNRDHNAAADAGRYNKSLLAADALKAITTVANAARNDHYFMTLPWLDDGARILSAMAFEKYSETMLEHKGRFETEVRKFLANYDSYVRQAEMRLGDMFKETDYPSVIQLQHKFGFETTLTPVPSQEDFRVDISEAAADKIRREIESRANEATDKAIKDCFERIHEVTSKMAERLNGYEPGVNGTPSKGVFRDSLVENVRSLVEILPSLNITNNPDLDDIARQMHSELCRTDAADLRESDGHRAVVGQAAKEIADRVSTFF